MELVVKHSKRIFLMNLLWSCYVGVECYVYSKTWDWINIHYQCAGCLQSPINLVTAYTEKVNLQPLMLKNYDKEDEIKLENDGDNVIMEVNTYLNATVTGGNNDELFQVELIYFHWGTDLHTGSEHAVNFMTYPFEMQIVHRNVQFSGLDTASQGVNGYLTFGIFFREVVNDKTVPAGIKAVCASLNRIRQSGTSTILDDISLRSLITGLDLNDYYTYCGSLTLPPCSPNNIWIVFAKALDIDSSCLYKFRAVIANDKKNMSFNYRPLQTTGERKVFYNLRLPPQTG